MALFYLQISSLGRNQGRRATAAAAYRAGAKIRDERSGDLHNYASRKDVLHTEIMLPAAKAAEAPDWTRDRAQLWNAAERAETRRNCRVAREWQVGLPPELSAAQRLSLVRAFSQEIADRYNIAVDLAVHEPRPGSDPRNFHAHILGTTREITAQGLGAKAGIDMPLSERLKRDLPSVPEEFRAIRERWAILTNAALEAAHFETRVDHRTLRAQGIDREPRPRLPMAALKIERAGGFSYVAERLRTKYSARLVAQAGGAESSLGVDAPAPAASSDAIPSVVTPSVTTPSLATAARTTPTLVSPSLATPRSATRETVASGRDTRPAAAAGNAHASTLEEVRRAAREGWLRMRGEVEGRKPGIRSDQTLERGADDDYSP